MNIIVPITVLEIVQDDFPVWVKCKIQDRFGNSLYFTEKLPVISNLNLVDLEPLPAKLQIECVVISENTSEVLTVGLPYDIQFECGKSGFEVTRNKLA